MYKYIFFSCFSFRNRSDCGLLIVSDFDACSHVVGVPFGVRATLLRALYRQPFVTACHGYFSSQSQRLRLLRFAATRADMYDLRGFSHHLISVASFRTKYIYIFGRECRSSASILRQCACRRFTTCWQHRNPQHQHIVHENAQHTSFVSNVNTFCSRWYAIAIVIAHAHCLRHLKNTKKKERGRQNDKYKTCLSGAFWFVCVSCAFVSPSADGHLCVYISAVVCL